ncbi:hypothetical protein BKA66DRAFT_448661, partial [Pyrenochaeta sp. MPI-SDFR-AT-0127]
GIGNTNANANNNNANTNGNENANNNANGNANAGTDDVVDVNDNANGNANANNANNAADADDNANGDATVDNATGGNLIQQLQNTFNRNNPNGTPAAPGDPDDLNGDGVINVFEAVYLRKYHEMPWKHSPLSDLDFDNLNHRIQFLIILYPCAEGFSFSERLRNHDDPTQDSRTRESHQNPAEQRQLSMAARNGKRVLLLRRKHL